MIPAVTVHSDWLTSKLHPGLEFNPPFEYWQFAPGAEVKFIKEANAIVVDTDKTPNAKVMEITALLLEFSKNYLVDIPYPPCRHCKKPHAEHMNNKCLFGSTRYEQMLRPLNWDTESIKHWDGKSGMAYSSGLFDGELLKNTMVKTLAGP